jgi:hypothetical protein
MELAISRSFFLACVPLLAIVEQTCHMLTVGFCKDPFAVLRKCWHVLKYLVLRLLPVLRMLIIASPTSSLTDSFPQFEF